MPRGIYVRTPEHNRKNSEGHIGKVQSQETRDKRSESLRTVWARPSYRERVSQTMTGRTLSDKTKQKMSDYSSNRSKDHLEKLADRSLVHGFYYHEHYSRWYGMMSRCYNLDDEAYKWYGGRGITVCEEWHDVAVFCQWMDENMGSCPEGHSFDRIDNDRGYEAENMRWATHREQNRNQRRRKSE